MDKKPNITKLRGTEVSKHIQYRPNTAFDNWYTDSVANDSSFSEQEKVISYSKQPICGGRGTAIQQLSESMTCFNNRLKNPNSNYSNLSIEQHFKSLREENVKKVKDENEKLWGKMLNSYKKNFN